MEEERHISEVLARLRSIEDYQRRLETKFAKLEEDVQNTHISAEVLKAAFDPVKNLVYGMVATILLGFLGVIVSFFMKA